MMERGFELMEKIFCGDSLLSIIIRSDFHEPGIHFFTQPDFSQQLAYMQGDRQVFNVLRDACDLRAN